MAAWREVWKLSSLTPGQGKWVNKMILHNYKYKLKNIANRNRNILLMQEDGLFFTRQNDFIQSGILKLIRQK